MGTATHVQWVFIQYTCFAVLCVTADKKAKYKKHLAKLYISANNFPDESDILDTLPPKMKTDVAINVHIQALNKVQIFHDCDPALLRELVLKLRSVLFLPGDFVCRKVGLKDPNNQLPYCLYTFIVLRFSVGRSGQGDVHRQNRNSRSDGGRRKTSARSFEGRFGVWRD